MRKILEQLSQGYTKVLGENMRKVVVEIADTGSVKVEFVGDHFEKRILLRLLKAIRLEYRRRVRLIRQINLVDRTKKEKETVESVRRKELLQAVRDKKDKEAKILGVESNGANKITK